MSELLDRLAEHAGIEPSYSDYFGVETRVSDDTKRALLEALGYSVDDDDATAAALRQAEGEIGGRVPVEGEGALVPHERSWALSTQLYALRSKRNWGIGDFTDLADLALLAGEAGASAIGLNPLHELFPSNPPAASPYAPSSRIFLNAMYLDVERVPDFLESPQAQAYVGREEFQALLHALRTTDLVDYRGVWNAKRDALEMLFANFRSGHLERAGDRRAGSFRRFVAGGGAELVRLAQYEALAEYFRARDETCYGWLQWPGEYRCPRSPAVARFVADRRERVDFYLYLQWLADEQLGAAAAIAAKAGVGFYRDLAVGVDLNGADAWGDQDAILAGASLGAPPDALNALGQNWGLPPISPRALRERDYAPFAALLRANMRHARILRVDHVLALRRAFWIPRGQPATQGAYVRYDFDAMLGVLARESRRSGCVVVGEDLGTVPEGFGERLNGAGVLSTRLVYFERSFSDGTFFPPGGYPRLAAASIGTHDLPPLAGWWTGDDIALRTRIGLYRDGEAARDAVEERRHARFVLVDALAREDAADQLLAHLLREDAQRGGTLAVAEELSAAVHRFLARTPSVLAVVAIEDVLNEVDGVNVPGTVDEHPNWRRKRGLPLEAWSRDGRLHRIGAIMCNTQPVLMQEGMR